MLFHGCYRYLTCLQGGSVLLVTIVLIISKHSPATGNYQIIIRKQKQSGHAKMSLLGSQLERENAKKGSY